MVGRPDAFLKAAEAERPRLVLTDDIHFEHAVDAIFDAHAPVAGVDEQPAQTSAFEILRGAHGGGEDAGGFASGALVASRPGVRHHRLILFASHRLIGWFHAFEHLTVDERLAVTGHEGAHAIDVSWSPDVAVLDPFHDGMVG